MKVFISWSGPLGGQIAEQLRKWLPRVIQSVDVYLSSDDTHKGTRWREVVGKALESSNYGIICITPESIDSKWLNFEAGALSKKLEGSYVSPFLVRLRPADLGDSPLTQFQMTVHHDYQDVLKLMKSINSASERQLRSEDLEDVFRIWWPQLRDPINQLIKDHYAKKPAAPGRGTEEKIEELLILARGHEKILNDVSRNLRTTTGTNSVVNTSNASTLANVRYLLNQAYLIADEVARSGTSESVPLVQVRGLIGVIEKELFDKK